MTKIYLDRDVNDAEIATPLLNNILLYDAVLEKWKNSILDHGLNEGLLDDDHTQYFKADGTRSMLGGIYPTNSDTYDLGSSSYWWRKGFISEMMGAVMTEYTQWVAGGWLTISKDQGNIKTDVSSADGYIDFGRMMTPGDIVLIRALDSAGNNKVEYISITSLNSGTLYQVSRDKADANSTDPAWKAGTPFAVLGGTTGGWLELNAYDSPRISIWNRTGSAYNGQSEIIRLGDLTGHPLASSSKYGLWIGDASNYLKYENSTLTIAGVGTGLTAINGGNIQTDTITANQIAAGAITTSELAALAVTAAKIAANTITATQIAAGTITATELATGSVTSTKISVTNLQAVSANMGTLNVDAVLTIGTNGKLIAGTTGSTRTELTASGLVGYNGVTEQVKISSSTGILTAGGGLVKLDVQGLSISQPTGSYDPKSGLKFLDDGGVVRYIQQGTAWSGGASHERNMYEPNGSTKSFWESVTSGAGDPFTDYNLYSGYYRSVSARLRLTGADTAVTAYGMIQVGNAYLSVGNDRAFITGPTNIVLNTAMLTLPSGNMGIGFTPGSIYKLEANGIIKATANVANDYSSSFFAGATGGANNQCGGIEFTGTFGTGVPDFTPRRCADIWGGFSNFSAWGGEYIGFGVGGAGDAGSLTTQRMKLASDGSLFIGMNTGVVSGIPSRLDLGRSYSNGLTDDKCKIYLYDDGATDKYGFGVGGSSDIQYHSRGRHDFYIANVRQMAVTGSGVSIRRTTTATYPFEVNGDAGKTSGGTTWQVISDKRMKENIKPITGSLDKILALNPIEFNFNQKYSDIMGIEKDNRKYKGLIAQELLSIFPEMVTERVFENELTKYYDVSMSDMFFHLIKAVQELNAKIGA
jgi:hypothetical protein